MPITGPQSTITCEGSGEAPQPSPDPGPTPVPPPVTDTVRPVVTLKATRNGKSANYTLVTTATDNRGVVRFELRVDGKLLSTVPGSMTFRATSSHLVTAQAWDEAGNSAEVQQIVTR